jgi:formylglycine-generating enzyme required for sulfatase activity
MKAYAVPGARNLIDIINEETGLTSISKETLEEVQLRYPGAHLVDVDEWCEAKQQEQMSPLEWQETHKETYWEMLECRPPARMAGGAFLVGEPIDHLAHTGESRYEMFRKVGNKYLVSNRPVTVAEFNSVVSEKGSV